MGKTLRIFTAEPQTRHLAQTLRSMWTGLSSSRYMAYRLFIKDIRSEYSKSRFGMFWDFLDPLVLAGVFYLLAMVRVINPGDLGIPYAVFVVFGALLYQTFVEGATLPLDVIRRSSNILQHLKVPPEALLLSLVYRLLFNSAFRILVLLLVSVALLEVYRPRIGGETLDTSFHMAGFFKFLLCFPAILVAGLSIGVFLAPFNTIYSDVGRVVRIVLNPIRYATPVMYAIPAVGVFKWILAFNPVASILISLRSLATENVFPDPAGFLVWLGIHAIFLLLGWFFFHLSIPVLTERI